MSLIVFNVCILIGWLCVTVGACALDWRWGIVAAGLLMIALCLLLARMAGITSAPRGEGA